MLKKGLSQHLIKDKNVTDKMVRVAGLTAEDVVVEIGAGQGHLTRSIAETVRYVYAIEFDRDLLPGLADLSREQGNVDVMHRDFLSIPLSEFKKGGPIKVMGNIPYKITAPIIFKIIEEREGIAGAYLTMQREVAERVICRPCSRTYGGLSVVCQLLTEAAVLFYMKPSVFVPPPKVGSAFVSLIPRPEKIQSNGELLGFIRSSFQNKRKLLRHGLSKRYCSGLVEGLYAFMGFSPNVRAEEIEPEGFERMYEFLHSGVAGLAPGRTDQAKSGKPLIPEGSRGGDQ